MDGPGVVVAGGMLYVTSGNGGLVGRPGNVLLAFGSTRVVAALNGLAHSTLSRNTVSNRLFTTRWNYDVVINSREQWGRVMKRFQIVAAAMMLVNSSIGAQTGSTSGHWVGTWATAEVGRPQTPPPPAAPAAAAQPPQGQPATAPAPPAPYLHFNNQTLRQIVRTSVGGNRARVMLSNTFGTAPLTIGAAHVALRDKESAIAPSSDRALTFSGRPTITIPSGAMVYSDPVDLNIPALGDVVVDLYLPGNTNTPSPVTMHNGARQTSYVSQTGNHVGIPHAAGGGDHAVVVPPHTGGSDGA